MRVVAGSKKGRKLQALEGSDIVRPTTDKVKESVFNSIQFLVEGSTFLDLFSGSGQMGIEALSRGAKKAYFVDINRKSLGIIKQNIATVGFLDNAVVVNSDFLNFCSLCSDKIDIAYLDPPFSKGLLKQAIGAVIPIMSQDGKILCESSVDEQLDRNVGDFAVEREYKYGKIKITTYVKQ